MKKVIIVLLIALFGMQAAKSQKLSIVQIDKQTYQYYINGQWKELIKLANQALKQGIDFFYLRTRLGIAYYNRGQYRMAVQHFRKALEWYPDDKIITEYLYYSYLFGGMLADANNLLDESIELQNKVLKDPTKNFQSLQFYYTNLAVQNPDAARFSDIDQQYNQQGEQIISYGTKVPTIEASWRTFTGYKTFQYSYYAFDNLYRKQENNGTIEENPYYIRQHSFNFIKASVNNDKIDFLWNAGVIVGTAKRTDEITLTRGRWTTTQTTVIETIPIIDVLASGGLNYKLPLMNLNSYISIQAYGFMPNIQLTVNPTFYPFGKTNFYLSPSLIIKQDLEETQHLAALNAGIGIKQKLWINGEIWTGRIGYFNTGMGTLIFNDQENILNKYAATVSYVAKKWSIYLGYNLYTKERFITYDDDAGNTLTLPYENKTDVFTIGIIFYPNVK